MVAPGGLELYVGQEGLLGGPGQLGVQILRGRALGQGSAERRVNGIECGCRHSCKIRTCRDNRNPASHNHLPYCVRRICASFLPRKEIFAYLHANASSGEFCHATDREFAKLNVTITFKANRNTNTHKPH